jgi:hypothetical protein
MSTKKLYFCNLCKDEVAAEKLEVIRHKMKRLKETECRRSGKMDESLLYGLHGAVERYLAALAMSSTDREGK